MGSVAVDAPPPLPSPALSEIAAGISLLEPLSRRGSGPGLIVLVHEEASTPHETVAIREGVPSPAVKWAEESYVVAEIRAEALHQNLDALQLAVQAIKGCEKCQPKGHVGLVAYDVKLWNIVAPSLPGYKDIVAAVVYGDSEDTQPIADTTIPTIRHLAGSKKAKNAVPDHHMEYEYPGRSSFKFAVPFLADFHYASEAVSHTRNLTFLKKLMDGPYFNLEALWDEHTKYEFGDRAVEHTMATMVQEPYVNHVPTLTGGIGRTHLTDFYRHHFIFSNPDDTELELLSRTVGIDRVVDEFIFKFTHDRMIPWILPGVPPTGRRVEVPFTAFVNIRGDRLFHEHIGWDQASVLRQIGLLPEFLPFPYSLPDGRTPSPGKSFEYQVPAADITQAQKLRDKNSVPSNEMFAFKIREVDK